MGRDMTELGAVWDGGEFAPAIQRKGLACGVCGGACAWQASESHKTMNMQRGDSARPTFDKTKCTLKTPSQAILFALLRRRVGVTLHTWTRPADSANMHNPRSVGLETLHNRRRHKGRGDWRIQRRVVLCASLDWAPAGRVSRTAAHRQRPACLLESLSGNTDTTISLVPPVQHATTVAVHSASSAYRTPCSNILQPPSTKACAQVFAPT